MAQGHAPEKEKAASSKVEEKSSRDEETAGLVKEENEEKSPEEQERIDKILSSMRKLSSSYSETELLRLLEDYIGECMVCFFGSLFILLLVEVFVVKHAIGCFKDKQEKSFFVDCHVDRETNDLVFAVRQGKDFQVSSAANLGHFFDSKGYMLIDVIFEHIRQLVGKYEEESVLLDTCEKKHLMHNSQKASGGGSGRGSKIAVKSKGSSSSGKKSS